MPAGSTASASCWRPGGICQQHPNCLLLDKRLPLAPGSAQQLSQTGRGFMASTSGKPLWRKIVDFPLVVLVVAIVTIVATIFLAATVAKLVPTRVGLAPNIKFDLICAPLLIILYKLVI